MNKNKNPNNAMKHSSKAYVVLCYAKMKSGIVDAICLYKITDWGKYALVAIGETYRKKHLEAKASNMRASELKSRIGANKGEWNYDSLD